MPWCDDCDHFYTPSTLTESGQCPQGHQVVDPEALEDDTKMPWHFWLLLVALVGYLGWRLIQGIMLLLG